MSINLSVARIIPLLKPIFSKLPPILHVSGTNGKGSTTSYLSHILTESKIRTGRFNSPHLITARDSILINNKPVSLKTYEDSRSKINQWNSDQVRLNGAEWSCTEFELLTAVALDCFVTEGCQICVLEVGVGGREDATNIFPPEKVLCVGVTKVGLDHIGLLGSTLKEITGHKVGIFKKDVIAVVDGTNESVVLERAQSEATDVQCEVKFVDRKSLPNLRPNLLGDYQWENLSVAYNMIKVICDGYASGSKKFPNCISQISFDSIKKGVETTKWPGRLQNTILNLENGKQLPILLDGAHNPQSAQQLDSYLNTLPRPIVFIMAFTKGKNINPILNTILRPGDIVIATEFSTPVEGMPWIEGVTSSEIANAVNEQNKNVKTLQAKSIKEALNDAFNIRGNMNVVLCGSLYLVGDTLRNYDSW
ncbi:dihydrofolate synthase [Martiniozyma asiatica (nom. inval.)]|nr:dihydrofolate synthase [Martiniozyma asiatica]